MPFDNRTNRVSPDVENEGVDEDDEEEGLEGDHQSKPLKDPPRPTVPIREKSTCGNVDGAGVEDMARGRSVRRYIKDAMLM